MKNIIVDGKLNKNLMYYTDQSGNRFQIAIM